VGLPAAIAFEEAGFNVVGFDTNTNCINELIDAYDKALNVENKRTAEILYCPAKITTMIAPPFWPSNSAPDPNDAA
jgi:UDP-N-acetyl-D-mannosaminuronate dehydrogenase